MITSLLTGWILYQLSAPTWCWILLTISIVFKLIRAGIELADIKDK